ncbi:MAG TPA: tripartite tricarboxylate transporter TctB family protein [Casimicrobiaceae bacterium]
MSPRYRALLPYLLVLAAAAALYWNALHFGFTPRGDRPGPDVWPRAILALTIVTCLVRIANVLRRGSAPDPVSLADVTDGVRPGAEGESVPKQRFPLLLAAGIGLTIAYVALLGTLGFFVDTLLYIGALIRTGRYRRWPVIAAVALGGALAFMFVFMKIVYLSLPIGSPPFAAVSLALMQIMGIR